MQRFWHFIFTAGTNRASITYLAARLTEHLGRRALAAKFYAKALRLADKSSSRHVFQIRQLWEFYLERNNHRMGEPQVDDSLFDCSIKPDCDLKTPVKTRRRAPGYYHANFNHRGLRVFGFLRPGIPLASLELLVNERVVARKFATRVIPGLWIFVFGIWRDALAIMPERTRLEVRIEGRGHLLFDGSLSATIHTPQRKRRSSSGDVTHWKLDKKGYLATETIDLRRVQDGFLQTYQQVANVLNEALGIPLFLLYGTLLGQQRDEDFIPGDDDFDVGYFSSESRSSSVRTEGMRIATTLVKSGFVVTLNRNGRLFRVRLPGMPPACHLDVHPVWKEWGSVWIHPRANLQCRKSDFVPAQPAHFRGYSVLIPAHPRKFLEAYYGTNWATPDPSYSTSARAFPLWKSWQLARSFVSPAQFEQMRRSVESDSDNPEARSRLIATGLYPLYPLDLYKENCSW